MLFALRLSLQTGCSKSTPKFEKLIQDELVKNISVVPTNSYWTRVVGYGLFSLCVIHKEGLCPSSGDINRLMMITVVTGAKQ
jgi:hypothetical protein